MSEKVTAPFTIISALHLGNKDIAILGPDGLSISVDYDDVDHDQVRAATEKMLRILNQHWDVK